MVQYVKNELAKGNWYYTKLSEVLVERKELNKKQYPIYSVSVSEGVINQVDYLGRSFAAKDTHHYHLAYKNDIIYTKSPTGAFPYGIIKQSFIETPVAISPLYAVYTPITNEIGLFLHYYFLNPIITNNYLHPLIQKGAKNTINISNQQFISGSVPIPKNISSITALSGTLKCIQEKLILEKHILNKIHRQKTYILSKMFI